MARNSIFLWFAWPHDPVEPVGIIRNNPESDGFPVDWIIACCTEDFVNAHGSLL